jgi:hypothetical protein
MSTPPTCGRWTSCVRGTGARDTRSLTAAAGSLSANQPLQQPGPHVALLEFTVPPATAVAERGLSSAGGEGDRAAEVEPHTCLPSFDNDSLVSLLGVNSRTPNNAFHLILAAGRGFEQVNAAFVR